MTSEQTKDDRFNSDRKLHRSDSFCFECGPHVPCFTECCGKLQLSLTPYDVLRLRKRLGMTSEEFMDNHTDLRLRTLHGFPELMMKMSDTESRRCPFVTEKGCSVYEDRPGACRIYPLGRASKKHPMTGAKEEFYFTVREDHCRGFEFRTNWLISDWLGNQGMEEYNEWNDLLMELISLKARKSDISFGPQHIQMYMMACFNTEKFRNFVFESAFLNKFDVPLETVDKIRQDDEALLKFAFSWIKFALFREKTLSLK
ncbi:MAG: YkgJ family cysteine cluster protein [Syntrophaceae bacterium]|mgnify:CR=1 FL=1|nr:YkgJ family cysteine cluster protein [Syntrophaceae bacterium]